MYTIGEKIAELRKSRKMTQEELATIVGVSAQSVSKWENSQTMPDIMLLPTLANALEVTVNDLFSIASSADHYETIPPDRTPEYAYKELFKALQQGLNETASLSKEEISKAFARIHDGEGGQSGLISYNNGEMTGAAYVNRHLALSLVRSKSGSVSLFDDEKIAEVFSLFADINVRKLLKYMLTNKNATVTAAVTANKCGIKKNEAEIAFHKLESLGLVSIRQVDTGEERPIDIYSLIKEHKVSMAVYPLFEIARILAYWHETWIGFSC